MRRQRDVLIAAALCAAVVLGATAPAQAKVLGIVYPENCVTYDAATDALKKYLAEKGYGPGNLEVYVQKPAADPMSWTNALRKFAAVDADLIVVWGDSLLQTACHEKIRTPVGFGFVFEPGLCACARSAANPSGTASGATAKTPLQTLITKVRLMGDFKTVGAFAFTDDSVGQAQIEELRRIGKEQGFTVAVIACKREEAVDALKAAPDLGLLLLPGCPIVGAQLEELVGVAAARHLPTVSLQPPRGQNAALLSLYSSPEEQGRLVGEVAVQILKNGPSAAPAAPRTPKKIELEVNVPLARQLNLKVPMALLDSATRVIK
jgi:ABC-type uncharacterized transport system substrate-binding protein